jgi:DNA-binding transcriptional MocR family regulator
MANTMGTPLVLQKIICDFLRMGGYDRLLRYLRRVYARNLQLYAQALRRSCPHGTCLSRPAGGFVLWVQFPKGVDTVRLFHEALERNVSVAPGILFSAQLRYTNCVSLNVSSPWTDRILAALNLLGELAKAQLAPKIGKPAARKSA